MSYRDDKYVRDVETEIRDREIFYPDENPRLNRTFNERCGRGKVNTCITGDVNPSHHS